MERVAAAYAKLLDAFRTPTAADRGKPFWAWNGLLDREELIRQINVFHEMGFGGFFMHARTGLETEYLGEEWMAYIRACALEAERLGMEAWLYDEDRWPSGSGGGLVTEEEAFRSRYLTLAVNPEEGLLWEDAVVAAFAGKVQGSVCHDYRPLARGSEPCLEVGESLLVFSVALSQLDSFYNGYTYLDTLNPEATRRFLALTHERYRQACGDLFGTAIKGIFTDEPHRGAVMSQYGTVPNPLWSVPWTDQLPDRFAQAFGYDVRTVLPELFLRMGDSPVSRVKWQFIELLQQLFIEGYAKPIQAWCHDNRLQLTGHVWEENSLASQTAMSGSVMRFYEHMDVPGIDVLTASRRYSWVAKQAVSVARQLGKKQLLSEMYGATGWQLPLAGHKAVGDWQAQLGINVRCLHHAWYTMAGEAKRDYPGSISGQAGWYKDYHQLETYFARLGTIMSHGEPDCALLVIHPVESVWAQFYPGWISLLAAQDSAIEQLEQAFANTCTWLLEAGIDFDYGDEEMLGRLCQLERSESGSVQVKVGSMAYRAVLVAGLVTIRASTLAILQQFVAAGGQVIFAGTPPAYVDACPSEELARLASAVSAGPLTRQWLSAACAAYAPGIQITDAGNDEPITDIIVQSRVDGAERWYILLNTNRERTYEKVNIRIKCEAAEEWLCVTGERRQLLYRRDNGELAITACFPVGKERVYRTFSDAGSAAMPTPGEVLLPPQLPTIDSLPVKLHGPFPYKLNEPNVCVLDRISYRLGAEGWSDEMDVLHADQLLRRRLELPQRGGNMIQPWYARKFLDYVEETCGDKLSLAYHFRVNVMPQDDIKLAIEQAARWEIRLNGALLRSKEQRAEEETAGHWIDCCFQQITIPYILLKQGANRIELTAPFAQGINLEAIYLLGSFGVAIQGTSCVLTALPERLEPSCITSQGLPFYSGTVSYLLFANEPEIGIAEAGCPEASSPEQGCSERQLVLRAPGFSGSCLRLSVDDAPAQLAAWPPYEWPLPSGCHQVWLDVVLTRRNTFGPLHLAQPETDWYGPSEFLTYGEQHEAAWVLYPAGLTAPPELVRRQPACMVEQDEADEA